MITIERQYQISKAQVAKVREAIDAPDSSTRTLHPRAQKVLHEAVQCQLDDFIAEVAEYERLRDASLTAITAESIAAVASALIKARIMRNWTQKALADKRAVAELQVQRYEATQYKDVSVEHLEAATMR